MADHLLYYGDNLGILRDHISTETIDLVYLDPPFNSDRNYNVLYKDESGKFSESQITAFEDTWHWNQETSRTYHELVTKCRPEVAAVIGAFHDFIGTNQMMAYLVMMAIRLQELHRVLKPSGSIYLHCDTKASHYLKALMDAIFGGRNFRNEIIWHYGGRGAKAKGRQFPRNHDVILFYSKTPGARTFSRQYIKRLFTPEEARKRNCRQNEAGRWFKTAPRGDYTDESILRLDTEDRIHRTKTGGIRIKYFLETESGLIRDDELVGDTWLDIPDAMHMGHEFLGYPTQKPLKLLERIILSGTEKDDIVLDPFCGCGTAVAAAQKLGRRWIGIDITHLSIALQRYRLQAMFPGIQLTVIGEPKDLGAARHLALDDRYQFQWWALSLIRAQPLNGGSRSKTGKKGSDKGIDGIISFIDDATGKPKRALAQVKSGKVKSGDVRDLVGTVNRENAALGALITLEEPTKDMTVEAATAGFYRSPGWGKDYARVQILTVADLMHGKNFECPPTNVTFRRAPRSQEEAPRQHTMLDMATEEGAPYEVESD